MSKITVYTPTTNQPGLTSYRVSKLFLAGTIEMGNSENWQQYVINKLTHKNVNRDLSIFNPRRDDWDSSWEQNISDDQFRNQVLWEQKWIKDSNIVLLHLEPESKSPISLLELGQLCQMSEKKVVVSCPDGFYRKGNVEIMCALHDIPLTNNIDDAIGIVKTWLY